MSDATAVVFDDLPAGRVLDGLTSFGRGRDEARAAYGLLAQSAPMQALVRAVARLAPHARATLITGETGTGKGTLAAIAHRLGPCRGGAQITLLGADDTSELASLRAAARGARTPLTCFVPELRDLPIEQQSALVRALVAAAGLPLGEGLHVIAGTSLDPVDAIARGLVRADLVYRLGAVRLHVPTLAARRADLTALATTLLRDACRTLRVTERRWSGAALTLLEARHFPGNVRELRNVVLRAAALTDDVVISAHTVHEACGPDVEVVAEERAATRARVVDAQERERVLAALTAAGGNKSAAAIRLGVSRRAFYRLLERLGA